MAIPENLRQLRQQCGMTQEQAASRVGITRQALSSYESGRTRPDIDMLMRLGELYSTSLEEILYGGERQQKAARRIRAIAIAIGVLLLLLTLIRSALLCGANHFFVVQEGMLSPEEQTVLASRIQVLDACELADTLLLVIAFGGFALLFLLLAAGTAVFPLRAKAVYATVLVAALLTVALLFCALDPRHSVAHYVITPLLVTGHLIIFLAADALVKWLQRRRCTGGR